MNQPRRHRPSLDPNPSVASRMASHSSLDLLRVGVTLATPEPAACLVNDADRGEPLRHVQTNKPGHPAVSHVQTPGRPRPDHGTMEASGSRPRLPDVHTCT